ncbi:MAG: type 1 glutamine amidotransferase [Verrucomicrobiales bacterium]|jgi:GMP synthase (glutamine-hydrolysing)|nr:type 1 glutamine amidotransferase [Verrucomicrobiales bacterium]
MRKRLHIFQHVPFENAEHIAVWAERQGFTISVTRWFAGEHAPSVDDIDWLVIMGGPMNIYEHRVYPWLIEEKGFISEAIRLKKKVIGVCLGAQLIADRLGARVYQNLHKEIGWLPLQWSPLAIAKVPHLPKNSVVFHWHGDTFDLPAGSERIASTAVCLNQGFSYHNHILAFQFHIESSPGSVRTICQHCRDELVPGKYIQPENDMVTDQSHFAANHELLEYWLAWLLAQK